jgi:hypothetical protein
MRSTNVNLLFPVFLKIFTFFVKTDEIRLSNVVNGFVGETSKIRAMRECFHLKEKKNVTGSLELLPSLSEICLILCVYKFLRHIVVFLFLFVSLIVDIFI